MGTLNKRNETNAASCQNGNLEQSLCGKTVKAGMAYEHCFTPAFTLEEPGNTELSRIIWRRVRQYAIISAYVPDSPF